jgi:hypothetical protein
MKHHKSKKVKRTTVIQTPIEQTPQKQPGHPVLQLQQLVGIEEEIKKMRDVRDRETIEKARKARDRETIEKNIEENTEKMKSGTEKPHFKQALDILAEHNERQQQVLKKITSG